MGDGSEPAPAAAAPSLWLSFRALTAAVVFLGTSVLYAMRVNLSVAIVCMSGNSSSGDVDAGNSSSVAEIFDWDRSVQGQVLGAFFFGYMLLQIPAGVLAQRFGPKFVIGALMSLASVSTMLMPPAARFSWRLAVALRVLTGLGSGVMFPGLHQLWSAWAPPLERSKLVGFSYAGAQIGTVVALPLSSLLCDTVGWQYIFYLFGGFGLLWVLCWFLLVFDSPEQHPSISNEERQYIQQSLIGQVSEKGERSAKLPLLSVATSLPVWAIVVGNVTYDWGGYTFLTNLPTYMKDVLGFSMVANGFVSSLPYIGFYLLQLAAAWLADWLQASATLSTGATRKLMSCVSMLAPGAIVVVLGFVDSSLWQLAVALLVLGISCKGAGYSGMLVNHVDIAPRYAGVLFAFSNTVASLTGLLAPIVVSAFVQEGLQAEWRRVFFLTAGIYAAGSLAFSLMASGDLQPWAAAQDSDVGAGVVELPMAEEALPLKEKLEGGGGDEKPSVEA